VFCSVSKIRQYTVKFKSTIAQNIRNITLLLFGTLIFEIYTTFRFGSGSTLHKHSTPSVRNTLCESLVRFLREYESEVVTRKVQARPTCKSRCPNSTCICPSYTRSISRTTCTLTGPVLLWMCGECEWFERTCEDNESGRWIEFMPCSFDLTSLWRLLNSAMRQLVYLKVWRRGWLVARKKK
jgi:hypothetical protein